jgi:Fe2+ or Zn2+ uptake regulation protein
MSEGNASTLDESPPPQWIISSLHSVGLKATPARCIILQALATGAPLTIPELVAAVGNHTSVLRPTYIRNATRRLAQAGVIQAKSTTNGDAWQLAEPHARA